MITCPHTRLSEPGGTQCLRPLGHEGDCLFDHNRTVILSQWHAAYHLWETGQGCSPSTIDLIRIGHQVDPARFHSPHSEAGDLQAEELFNLQCEGLELDVCFDNLFTPLTQETS